MEIQITKIEVARSVPVIIESDLAEQSVKGSALEDKRLTRGERSAETLAYRIVTRCQGHDLWNRTGRLLEGTWPSRLTLLFAETKVFEVSRSSSGGRRRGGKNRAPNEDDWPS